MEPESGGGLIRTLRRGFEQVLLLKASRRYTILIADRTTGVVRRVTVGARPAVAFACAVVTLPVLVGLGAAWKAKSEVADLYASEHALAQENASYRTATAELSGQIQSLQAAIADLGARSALDPDLAHAMETLPALVKARAMGGAVTSASRQETSYASAAFTALANPEDTFGLIRTLLEGLETNLHVVQRNVERRNALADATPSIWPAHGWLSSTMGRRSDPMTGDSDYHAGLDIAGDRGQPVYATAAGVVTFAGRQGAYGNLIEIDHGFGLETRYGHLSRFQIKQGDRVTRGDLIGNLGSTGRTTGTHLHYEVLANGRLLNPLRLLTQQKPRDR
jgi:murein DD-endopeptidase MepM/ murein hydrolase activator NlpD